MPCNAVATVTARVADVTLLCALAPAQGLDVLQAYLAAAYPDLRCAVRLEGARCLIHLSTLRLVLEADGRLTLPRSAGNVRERQILAELPAALDELFRRACGLALQQRIRQTLAGRYTLLEELQVGESLALRIEC
jgi:hypothetical protein